MFRFDRTSRSIVVICTQCGTRDIATTQSAADRWALDHVNRAHPGPSWAEERRITANAAARQRRHRDTPR